MGVGQDDRVDPIGRNRQVMPVALAPLFRSLKHPAVDKNLQAILSRRIACMDEMLRAGDRSGGAKKLNVGQAILPDCVEFYFSVGSILNMLLAVLLSGTLPSLTTISCGGTGVSTRITPLFRARTSSRCMISPPLNLTITGTSAPVVPRLSTVIVTIDEPVVVLRE